MSASRATSGAVTLERPRAIPSPSARKGLVKVGYGCNENCTFCHTLDTRHIDDDAANVDRKIDRAAELGYDMVVLSGGEPTIRPELTRWARRSAAHGMSFGLVTNGLMLAYPDLVDALLRARLGYVYLSLHGGSAKIHNACVRAETFAHAAAALEDLAGRGLDLTVNCVITRTNLDHLIEMVDFCLPYDDAVLNFSMTEPKGGGELHFDRIVPNVSEVAARVREAITYGREHSRGLRFAHGGLPLCLLPGLEDLYGDLRSHGFVSMTEVWESDYHPIDARGTVQPEPCAECRLRGGCPGLFRGYADRRGCGELRPTTGPRSNSFNYRPLRTLPWPEGAPCPVRRNGPTPYATARALFLRTGGAMHAFETTTRDFADVEIARVKDDLGQLYLDVSQKDAPDDFARDLRKLREVAACGTCPERDGCGRCFEPDPVDVFARDDASLRERLSALEGDVLELGCGDGRYTGVFAETVARGVVRYRGIDPDGAALERLRERHGWAWVETGTAEDITLPPESLDHVLLLNSYNHLTDPAAVLRRCVEALRPGGTIVVVDNAAFGLLRTPQQVARGEGGAAGFEHYRNATADDVVALFRELPVRCREVCEVDPGRSNLWIVHGERRPPVRRPPI